MYTFGGDIIVVVTGLVVIAEEVSVLQSQVQIANIF